MARDKKIRQLNRRIKEAISKPLSVKNLQRVLSMEGTLVKIWERKGR